MMEDSIGSMPAPHDGLSLVEETSLSQLRQRLQRDINCLSDQDRSTRRRALAKLKKVFFQESKVRQRGHWSVPGSTRRSREPKAARQSGLVRSDTHRARHEGSRS